MRNDLATQATVTLRPGLPTDAEACGRVCYAAFSSIANQHNFPSDFPSVEVATGLMNMLLSHPQFFNVVAELDGKVVGSNFLDERSPIAGLGPITVDPEVQNRRLGRRLMESALDRVHEHAYPGVRLLQAAYHGRSCIDASGRLTRTGPDGGRACARGSVLSVCRARRRRVTDRRLWRRHTIAFEVRPMTRKPPSRGHAT